MNKKVTVPAGRLFIDLVEGKGNGLIHCHCVSLRGKAIEVCGRQMVADCCQIAIYHSLFNGRAKLSTILPKF
jgi:hypothetical protein